MADQPRTRRSGVISPGELLDKAAPRPTFPPGTDERPPPEGTSGGQAVQAVRQRPEPEQPPYEPPAGGGWTPKFTAPMDADLNQRFTIHVGDLSRQVGFRVTKIRLFFTMLRLLLEDPGIQEQVRERIRREGPDRQPTGDR